MKTFIKRALLRKWKWAYYHLFTLRLWFYRINEDYDKIYLIKDEPIKLR